MAGSNRRRGRAPLADQSAAWLAQHLQSAVATLGRLTAAPLPTGLTVAVIGIALALPAALFVMTENLRVLTVGWHDAAAVSLFLRQDIDDRRAADLAEALRADPLLERVELIPRASALAEFREFGGFDAALDQLSDNPLPAVLALYPARAHASPADLDRLQQRLQELPEADFARVDTLWLQRFEAIVGLIGRAILLIGLLFGLGVLLIVGNTIRLEILHRHHEIEIMELVGATDAFIRRPFLYMGAWFGLLGALVAWLLVGLSLFLMSGPVSHLASLYLSEFPLTGLAPGVIALLLVSGMLLGLAGSWVAVNRQLRGAKPR